jgi:fluoride exporter
MADDRAGQAHAGAGVTAWTWIAVAVVGGAGAIARLVVDREVGRRFGDAFPSGTLVINLSGSFLLGLVTGLALSTEAALIIGTATIGSYTTFSTWMFETDRLAEGGALRAAAANLVVSIVLGVALAALGRTVGGWL